MIAKIPVALIFFHRRCVLDVVQRVRDYAPEQLYLIADGGRTPEEHARCLEVRQLVEATIDWPCRVERLYSGQNLGCRGNIPRGITWVFSQVDRAAILEDDTVPTADFFSFCAEMLERYADDARIMTVSGTNFFPDHASFGAHSYLFSGYAETWGYATWARAWKLYDPEMGRWPAARDEGLMKNSRFKKHEREFWISIFDSVWGRTCDFDPYDYQWQFACLLHGGLCIVPRANLVTNIGDGPEATHMQQGDSRFLRRPVQALDRPLVHPSVVRREAGFDRQHGQFAFYRNAWQRFRSRVVSALPEPVRTVLRSCRTAITEARGRAMIGMRQTRVSDTQRIRASLQMVRLPPPRGCVRWGSLRRTSPISRVIGLDRGQPIDRYYIERFLTSHRADIAGRVLEIGDPGYTREFGGDRVTRSDVLHAVPGNSLATLVGDLATGEGIPQNVFDCTVLTQTLLVVYDVHAAVQNVYAALKPGGVVLATIPGICQISRYDMDRWGDYWRFTDASALRLFGDVFGPENVQVAVYGNVLAACALLHGLAAHELKRGELDYFDPDYQVTIGVRAAKRGGA